MKELILNDGRRVEIQSISDGMGVLHIRMILQNSDQLKALFQDEFSTMKMTERENGKEVITYENYTALSYIKEEAGGIWEVEMTQPEADIRARMAAVEAQAEQNTGDLQMAIAELTMVMAELIPQKGEEENV